MSIITIVGCGFIGSTLSEELAKLAFSQDLFKTKFKFVDFDTWEDRNAANQNVNLEEAKKKEFKVITCARYVNGYNFEAEAIKEKLTAQNAEKILEGSDLIIDCLDNIPTRQILWGLGVGNRPCPVLHSGISRKGSGIINWSSTEFDTFPFRPDLVAGRDLQEQDIKEPPCEMYKYRQSGLILVSAIAKAVAFYLGKDPWGILQDAEEKGAMTCWHTSSDKATMIVDDEFLRDGFFPIHKIEDREEEENAQLEEKEILKAEEIVKYDVLAEIINQDYVVADKN